MFVFPIGFSKKTPRFPWMCLGLSLFTAAFSFTQFPVMKKYETELTKDTSKYQTESGMIFFYDFCTLRTQDEEFCSKVTKQGLEHGAKKQARKKDKSKEWEKIEKAVTGHIAKNTTGRKPQSQAKEIEEVFSEAISQVKAASHIADEFQKIMALPEKTVDAEVLQLASFQKVLKFRKEIEAKKVNLAKELGLLSKKTMSFINLIKAQFTHGDFLHLAGNLMIFLLLGVFLESRVGSFPLFSLFLATGTVGFIAHFLFEETDGTVLVGASAGVAGVMGAFLALYWNRHIRVWISAFLFFGNRVILAPTYLVILGLFILRDLTGIMNGAGSVAHDAHLGGALLGFMIGLAYKKLSPLEDEALYPDESDLLFQMKNTQNPDHIVIISKKILEWNPQNKIALQKALQNFSNTSSMATFLKGRGAKEHLSLSSSALKQGDWFVAMRIYDSFLFQFNKHPSRQSVVQSIQDLTVHLKSSGNDMGPLNHVQLSSDILTIINKMGDTAWEQRKIS